MVQLFTYKKDWKNHAQLCLKLSRSLHLYPVKFTTFVFNTIFLLNLKSNTTFVLNTTASTTFDIIIFMDFVFGNCVKYKSCIGLLIQQENRIEYQCRKLYEVK